MSLKIYCTNMSPYYAEPLLRHIKCAVVVSNIGDADLVIFTGGEDVYPKLYGEESGSRTYANPRRDDAEVEMFEWCRKKGIKMIGVCRGAQFLTVMSGGKLIQHVTNHGVRNGHSVDTNDGRSFVVSSTHHQMMLPYGLSEPYTLFAWANGLSSCYLNGEDKEIEVRTNLPRSFPEPEVVWYHNTDCLCFQYHPEIMDMQSEGVLYFVDLIKKHMKGELQHGPFSDVAR